MHRPRTRKGLHPGCYIGCGVAIVVGVWISSWVYMSTQVVHCMRQSQCAERHADVTRVDTAGVGYQRQSARRSGNPLIHARCRKMYACPSGSMQRARARCAHVRAERRVWRGSLYRQPIPVFLGVEHFARRCSSRNVLSSNPTTCFSSSVPCPHSARTLPFHVRSHGSKACRQVGAFDRDPREESACVRRRACFTHTHTHTHTHKCACMCMCVCVCVCACVRVCV